MFTSRDPKYRAGRAATASAAARNGKIVWDAKVEPNGVVPDSPHVGHTVTELFKPLPTLNDPARMAAIKADADTAADETETAAKHFEAEAAKGNATAAKVGKR